MRGLAAWVLMVLGPILAVALGSWLLLALVVVGVVVLLWDRDYATMRRMRQ